MRNILSATCLLAATGLGGCVNPQKPLSADFGLASHQNFSAQVADPDAAYPPASAAAASGARAALAQQRYIRNQVVRPAITSTTDAAPAAGGGGGGGGGQGAR